MRIKFNTKHLILAALLTVLLGGTGCAARGIMLQDGEADYHDLNDRTDLDELLLENAEIEQDDVERY